MLKKKTYKIHVVCKVTWGSKRYIIIPWVTQTTILCLHVISPDKVNSNECNECTVIREIFKANKIFLFCFVLMLNSGVLWEISNSLLNTCPSHSLIGDSGYFLSWHCNQGPKLWLTGCQLEYWWPEFFRTGYQ